MSKTSEFHWPALKHHMRQESQKLTLGKLGRVAGDLIEWIVKRYDPARPLHVQDVVMNSGVASPAAIHKGLDTLATLNLIDVAVDKTDTRRRIISPTAKVLREFQERDKALFLWVARQGRKA
jgi:hypothetical protein